MTCSLCYGFLGIRHLRILSSLWGDKDSRYVFVFRLNGLKKTSCLVVHGF